MLNESKKMCKRSLYHSGNISFTLIHSRTSNKFILVCAALILNGLKLHYKLKCIYTELAF